MKNVSRSPVTEMLSGKYKIFLVVLLAIMLAVDFGVCLSLWITGVSASMGVPLFLMLLDGVYLFTVALSNQRFAYARTFFLIYLVITLPVVVAWTLIELLSNEVVFVGASAGLWVALHFVGIAATIITYVYAAKRIGGGRTVQLAAAIAAAAVALIGAVYYGIALINDGFFGQGAGVRPLVFEFRDDDTCAVVGVLGGKGDEIVVPYEVSGSKVTWVSAQVLTDGVKKVHLRCDKDTTLFIDVDDIYGVNENVELYVDKKASGSLFDVDSLKTALYGYKAANGISYTHWLGNRVRPEGLEADEVYVTFGYSVTSYVWAEREVIPTWYGKAGDVLDLFENVDLGYVVHSDKTSDDDLYWSYYNYGYIMSDIDVVGKKITSSVDNALVDFERVYKVFVGEGNDEMCPSQELFNYSHVDGEELDYKLTVERGADRVLDCLNRGAGFKSRLTWESRDTSPQYFTSLEKVLNEMPQNINEITVTPTWFLDSPVVKISAEKTNVVYGDPFKMTAELTHPLEDVMEVSYEWYANGLRRKTGNEYAFDHIDYTGTVDYTLSAVVTAPEVTSLTAGGAAQISITSDSRPVTVKWGELSGDVFDGTPKTAEITLSNVIEGDIVTPSTSAVSYVNAGSYYVNVYLSGSSKSFYYIDNFAQDGSHTYVVKPRPVVLDWDDVVTYEYDGDTKCPRAVALDVSGNPLVITYNGGSPNAGEHTVSARLTNPNYTIDTENGTSTCDFTVTPKVIDVTWSTENTFEFNGQVQKPTATAKDVHGNDLPVEVYGVQMFSNMHNGVKDEGKDYIATAAIANGNYRVSDETKEHEFFITPKPVNATWSNTSLVYNGREQKPTARITGIDGRPIGVRVTGEQTNASSRYNADGTVTQTPYTATATPNDSNYVINNHETLFTISPMYVSVLWSNRSLVYNGRSQMPTARVIGANGESVAVSVSYTDPTVTQTIDCGNDYSVTATITDNNYTLDRDSVKNSTTGVFAITKRRVYISWIDAVSYVYNGSEIMPLARTTDELASELQIELTVTQNGSVVDSSVNAGMYTVTADITNNDNCTAMLNTYEYTIMPRPVAVTWSNTEVTYNNALQKPVAEANGLDGNPLDISVSVSGTPHNVDTYTATAHITDDNYTISNPQTDFVIKPREITVTVYDLQVEYGKSPADVEKEIMRTVEGELLGDVTLIYDMSYNLDDSGKIAVGVYKGALSVVLVNNESGNYTVIVEKGTLTVFAPTEEESI